MVIPVIIPGVFYGQVLTVMYGNPVIIPGVFCGQVLTVVTDLMYGNSRDNSQRVLWTGLDGGDRSHVW